MENYMTFSIDDEYTSIDEIRKFIDNASAFTSDDSCVIRASLKFTIKVYPQKIICGDCAYGGEDYKEDLLINAHKCSPRL